MKTPAYLTTVPDSVVMTRDEFIKLIHRFKHHRSIKFGFSKKHTADIEQYRKQVNAGDITNNVYSLPVVYNTEVTYVAN